MKTSTTSYHTWAPVTVALGFLLACNSGGTNPGGASTGGPGPQSATTGAVASGPLPLMAAQGQRVSYTIDGAAKEFLDYPGEHVKVSATCAKPDGTLDCEAMRLLRRGKSVQLAPNEMATGIAPGAVICRKLNIQSTVGRGPTGNEDGFCQFADGSLAAHGSVESHVLQAP